MTDQPEITITIHGAVGIGKSAIALTILDALREVGVNCSWEDEASERNMGTGAQELVPCEFLPVVRLVETNPSMEKPPARRVELTSGMVAQLFAFAGQDPEPMPEGQSELTIEYSEAGHSGAGYYAHFTDVPEGGAVLLDGINPPRFGEPDDEPSSLPTIDPPAGPCAECESGECEATASAPAEPFLVPALEEGTPIPVHTEHGYHPDGMDACPICEEQNNAAKVRAIGEKSFIVTGLTTAQLVQKLVEIGRGVDALNLLQASLSGYGVKPVFSPYWFELTADGQVSLARVANAEWPDWAREAADRFMFNTNQDHVEIARLRMQAEQHMRSLEEASRMAWCLVRSAPGGTVVVSDRLLATTDWSLAKMERIQGNGGCNHTWVARLQGQPQPAGLHESMALIDSALGYLSTALGDLESSRDPRPGIMVQEAMGCLRQSLIGAAP